MQCGGWVPICKKFVASLPLDRKYTELEAAYSLSIDYDNRATVTILGYAKLWRWSRTRVSTFLCEIGVELVKLDRSSARKTRSRLVVKHQTDKQKTLARHKRLIDSKWLSCSSDNKKSIKRHEKSTTRDPDPLDLKKVPPNRECGGELSVDNNNLNQDQMDYLRLMRVYGDARSFAALAGVKRKQWKERGSIADRDREQLNLWQKNENKVAVSAANQKAIQTADFALAEIAEDGYESNLVALPEEISSVIANLNHGSGLTGV